MRKGQGPQMFPWGRQGAEVSLQRPLGHAPIGEPPPHQPAWIQLRVLGKGSRGDGGAVASSERLCLPPLRAGAGSNSLVTAKGWSPGRASGVSGLGSPKVPDDVWRRPDFQLSCKKQIRKNLLPKHVCSEPAPRAPKEP